MWRAGELLEALLGEDPGLVPLEQLLVKRGNPFFREETVRTLVETKALAGERGRYRLTQPVQAIQVPPTVQAMLASPSTDSHRMTNGSCRSPPSSARTFRSRCSSDR